MSDESTKTRQVRSPAFIDKYLTGKVVDIGGGNDPVVSSAEVFDLNDGDAQFILDYREKGSYDCVHSSHCLEHMVDVPNAISQWWGLVKQGGFMIVVVPHEDLYEQKKWPPIFNTDHKATFRINQTKTWSPISYDIFELAQGLPNANIVESDIHDLNYDYNLQFKSFNKPARRLYKWAHSQKRFKRPIANIIYNFLYSYWYKNNKNVNGQPIDQTSGDALAQIQIVIQKIP